MSWHLEQVDRSKKSFDEQNKSFEKDSLIDRLIDWLYDPQATKVRTGTVSTCAPSQPSITILGLAL